MVEYRQKGGCTLRTYTIDDHIRQNVPGLRLGILHYDDVSLSATPVMLKGRINLFLENMRYEYLDKSAADVPGISQWRKIFKTVGMDPSRYRPSSEALVRRVLQNKPFHWIHTGVDVNNFLSLQFGLPAGLYNRDLIEGDVCLRLGRNGETYEGLNGREISCEGKLVLVDENGPFGSPFTDSVRTSVKEDATRLLHVFFIYPDFALYTDEQLLRSAGEMFTHVNGGTCEIAGRPFLIVT
jgi:DNA/RNA-binding domain of Phe-tRNA-synthetase-like protein